MKSNQNQSNFRRMVAIIHKRTSLRNALHYNENTVRQKVANLFMQATIRKDTELLSFSDKINRLERLTKLNQRTKVNSVHLSLNFDLTDDLKTKKLKTIADVYMSKIGFGAQPYLVYQHTDAGASAHSHSNYEHNR